MTDQPGFNFERLNELLAERAAFGLSADDERELNELLAGSSADREMFERTAAQATLAFHSGPLEPLPERLRERIAAGAVAHLAAVAPLVSSHELSSGERPTPPRKVRYREVVAWMAAAACLLFALIVSRRDGGAAPFTPAEERAQLIQRAPDVVQIPWTATDDPAGKQAAGDVVWSTAKQSGYLRFKGLAPNDPAASQYQLWIFDANQDKRYPIDGGVFDIGAANVDRASGDTIVPIRAKLHVAGPQMFAVTVEKPGGVVVSSRDRIALLAKANASGG